MKLTQLNEGLRFGKDARRMVDLEARDILIGVEYEFNWTEEVEGSQDQDEWNDELYDQVRNTVEERIDRDIEEKKSDYLDNEVDNRMSEAQVGDVTSAIQRVKNAFEAKTLPLSLRYEVEDFIETADSLREQRNEVEQKNLAAYNNFITIAKTAQDEWVLWHSEVQVVSNYWADSAVSGEFKNHGDLETFMSNAEDFANALEELHEIDFDDSEDVAGMDSDLFYNLDGYTDNLPDGNDSEWDDWFMENFRENAERNWDDEESELMGYDTDQPMESPFWEEEWEEAQANIEPRRGDAADIVDAMQEELENSFPMYDDIEAVVEDVSVPDGGEVVTNPLPFKKSFVFMEEMFSFIKEHGSTASNTGMHVNMSVKGLSFGKDFNKLKLAMLADVEFMQSDTKFPPRGNVARQFDRIDKHDMGNLVQLYNSSGFEAVLGELEDLSKLDYKSQGINFGSMRLSDISQRRIEFRFFGGDGYEDKFEEMERGIYKAAYAMMVAYSPTFGQEEYWAATLKFLDKKMFEHSGSRSFLDVARKAKGRNPKLAGDIFKPEAVNSEKFINNKQRHSLFSRLNGRR